MYIRRFGHSDLSGLLAILAVGLLIRIALSPVGGSGFDIRTMQTWSSALQSYPLADFYNLSLDVPTDHLPGDLWILVVIGQYTEWFTGGQTASPHPIVIKMVAVTADLTIAAILYFLVRRIASHRTALVTCTIFCLGPATVGISAVWGQWDAVSTALMVGALYMAVRRDRWALTSWPLLAYACLIKPQLGVIAPVLLVYQLRRGGTREIPRNTFSILMGLTLVQLASLPFGLGLTPWPTGRSLFSVIQASVEEYSAITLGAHNLWGLIIAKDPPPDDGSLFFGTFSYQVVGLLLFAIAYAVGLLIIIRLRETTTALFLSSWIVMMSLYMFQTRMHERYLFPALPLALISAALVPKLRIPAYLLQFTFALNIYTAHTYADPDLWIPGFQTDLFFRLNAIANFTILTVAFSVGIAMSRRSEIEPEIREIVYPEEPRSAQSKPKPWILS